MSFAEERRVASEQRKTDALQRLQGDLERAMADFSMMQARLQAIKESYAVEVSKKEGEVAELGEAFDELRGIEEGGRGRGAGRGLRRAGRAQPHDAKLRWHGEWAGIAA